MEIRRYSSVQDFLSRNRPILEQNEAQNSTVLGLAERMLHSPQFATGAKYFSFHWNLGPTTLAIQTDPSKNEGRNCLLDSHQFMP